MNNIDKIREWVESNGYHPEEMAKPCAKWCCTDIGPEMVEVEPLLALLDGLGDGWVSVDDSMPDYMGSYLIAYSEPNKPQLIAWSFHNSQGKWCKDIGFYDQDCVTHWLPLPHPPTNKE